MESGEHGMSITFSSDINDIGVEMLDGFFVGWA